MKSHKETLADMIEDVSLAGMLPILVDVLKHEAAMSVAPKDSREAIAFYRHKAIIARLEAVANDALAECEAW